MCFQAWQNLARSDRIQLKIGGSRYMDTFYILHSHMISFHYVLGTHQKNLFKECVVFCHKWCPCLNTGTYAMTFSQEFAYVPSCSSYTLTPPCSWQSVRSYGSWKRLNKEVLPWCRPYLELAVFYGQDSIPRDRLCCPRTHKDLLSTVLYSSCKGGDVIFCLLLETYFVIPLLVSWDENMDYTTHILISDIFVFN